MIDYINQTLHTLTLHHKALDQSDDQAKVIHEDIVEITRMLKPIYQAEITEQLKILNPEAPTAPEHE